MFGLKDYKNFVVMIGQNKFLIKNYIDPEVMKSIESCDKEWKTQFMYMAKLG